MSVIKSEFIDPKFLEKHGIVNKVFNYNDYDLEEEQLSIYKYFENEFINLYKDYAELFGIKEYTFYLMDNNSCNAYAMSKKGYNVIGITNSYPILISQKFHEKYFENIDSMNLFKDKEAVDACKKLIYDESFDFSKFFKDCSIKFTFGHEFRHIRQFNNCNLMNGENMLQENLVKSEFEQWKHVWEFDSDRQGCYDVTKFVFRTHVGLKKRTDANMRCLLYLGCASMVITSLLFYFGVMNQHEQFNSIKKEEFYTKKNNHPHYLVRCANIISYYRDILFDEYSTYNFEYSVFVDNVFEIVDIYFGNILPSYSIFKEFSMELLIYMNEIINYNNELYNCAIQDNSIRKLLILSKIKFESYYK